MTGLTVFLLSPFHIKRFRVFSHSLVSLGFHSRSVPLSVLIPNNSKVGSESGEMYFQLRGEGFLWKSACG